MVLLFIVVFIVAHQFSFFLIKIVPYLKEEDNDIFRRKKYLLNVACTAG